MSTHRKPHIAALQCLALYVGTVGCDDPGCPENYVRQGEICKSLDKIVMEQAASESGRSSSAATGATGGSGAGAPSASASAGRAAESSAGNTGSTAAGAPSSPALSAGGAGARPDIKMESTGGAGQPSAGMGGAGAGATVSQLAAGAGSNAVATAGSGGSGGNAASAGGDGLTTACSIILDSATALDTSTGRTWERSFNGQMYSLNGAKEYCAKLTLPGTGWRLPSAEEIQTINDFVYSPRIDPIAFPDTPSGDFWTLLVNRDRDWKG